MRCAWIVFVTGCWSSPPSTPATTQPAGLVITQHGWGPINAATVATLANLRALFPVYRVIPVNDPQLEYDIYDGKQKLGFVINDDASVFNVHATSNRVRVEDRPWRAGESFQDSKALSRCECWGSNPTCYKTGEHIAVNFDRSCLEGDDPRELRALDGLVIQRVIWSVEPFGPAADTKGTDPSDSADPDAP